MKVLLVHNRYLQYGGEDATFEAEKKVLESRGHEVSVLIFDNKDAGGISAKLKLSYQLIYSQDSATRLEKAIREVNPDIIHVHNFFYMASPSVFYAAKRNNIPIVVTLQNYRLICAGGLLMRNSEPCELCVQKVFPGHGIRYSCHRNSRIQTAHLTIATGMHKLLNTWNDKVTRYIAVTEFGKRKYINSSLKLADKKIVVKASSVADAGATAPEERQDYFLFVGRLSKEKGIEILLKAFENMESPVEIIGDGPLRPLVEKSIARNPNIRYSGYRDKSYIISRLKTCRALVFPSVWYECLPVTILEAFSTGTPVIISDVGNLNEIVSHQYNGLHFKTNDADDLRKTLEGFNNRYRELSLLYANARKTYLDKYTDEVNYRNLIDIYQSAISENKSK